MRAKLIELVGQVQDCGCDVTDVVVMNYVENDVLVDHLIANGVTFAEDNNVPNKWIPVTERLPLNDTYILVTTDGVVVSAYWHNDRFYAFTANGVATVGGVTHWMHFPQPPKGE